MRTPDFIAYVDPQAVPADAYDVCRAPVRWSVIQQVEFGWQEGRVFVEKVDIGVYPRGKCLRDPFGVGPIGEPFTVHVAPVKK
jgi:hypothetical protein